MITNRTQTDVNEALRIRKEKVQQGIELTEDEIEQLERGMLTINTLNRIESKQEAVRELINSFGYWNTPGTNREWTETDIFTGEDAARLISNDVELKYAFFVYSTTPSLNSYLYSYETVNALEQILVDLERMADEKQDNFRICNFAICGD